LNIFAALSGVFSGKSKKTTDTNKDGSSHSVEHSTCNGRWKGAGTGTLNAVGESESSVQERHRIAAQQESMNQHQKIETADHLGIEAPNKK
jgi:hypothetical protein